MTQSSAVVPVRTKKRFTPPPYQPKYKTEKQFIDYARKAGLVIPQERLERPIHLACTGKALTQSPSVKGPLEKWNDLDCE